MKTRRVTLTDIFQKALTDKKFLSALCAKPTKTRTVLAKKGLSLSSSDMAKLKAIGIETAGKVIHPPPPPWEPSFIIASAVLGSFNERIAALEKKAVKPARRGKRAKK